jgi:hypothetical protein
MDRIERVKFEEVPEAEKKPAPVEEVMPVKVKEKPGVGEGKARLGIGFNYPGVSIKYLASPFAGEIKGQFGKGITVIGPRGYYYFSKKQGFFAGCEIDYLSFKGDASKGSGYALEGFVGYEHFVLPNFALSVDFGPATISLKDKDTKKTEGGLEFVANIGLTYYLGGGK